MKRLFLILALLVGASYAIAQQGNTGTPGGGTSLVTTSCGNGFVNSVSSNGTVTCTSVSNTALSLATTSCGNGFVNSVNSNGNATCASVSNTALTNSTITIAGKSTALGSSYSPIRSTFVPSNPTITSSTSIIMMGLGSTASFTPATSGNTLLLVSGQLYAGTGSGQSCVMVMKVGTGSAPANGASVTGTSVGNPNGTSYVTANVAGAQDQIFSLNGYVGLSAGTTYWFDMGLSSGNNTQFCGMFSLTMTVVEL